MTFVSLFVFHRKMTKEGLAQTTSDITENLMSISRMMAQQVQQSEESMTSLGTWRKSNLTRGLRRPSSSSFHTTCACVCWTLHVFSCPQRPPRGRSKRPTTSSRTWRGPSSWAGSSSPSTTVESWRINCSSSWLSPSSSPQFSTSSRRGCSPSCRPGTVRGALPLPHTALSTVGANYLNNSKCRVSYCTRIAHKCLPHGMWTAHCPELWRCWGWSVVHKEKPTFPHSVEFIDAFFLAHHTKGVVHHLGKGKSCASNVHRLFVSEVCVVFLLFFFNQLWEEMEDHFLFLHS